MAQAPGDLVRLADLIKLAARTTTVFSNAARDGDASEISDIAEQIEALAERLAEIGRELERKA